MYMSWWGGNHFFFTLPWFVCIDLCRESSELSYLCYLNFFLIFRIEVASTLFLMEVSLWCSMYLSRWGGNHCMFFFTLPLFVCIDLCYLNWCNQIRNPTWLLLQRVAKLVIVQGLFSQVRVLLTRSTACLDLISHTFCMKYYKKMKSKGDENETGSS